MKRYSIFAVAREAARYHTGWDRAWASPEPKKKYDAIIIGAGGHGLATAYYLGKNHGIKNVAILEKGWLGGGNTGRNTTIIRSNYLQDPSAAIYEKSRSLYETMSQDLNHDHKTTTCSTKTFKITFVYTILKSPTNDGTLCANSRDIFV